MTILDQSEKISHSIHRQAIFDAGMIAKHAFKISGRPTSAHAIDSKISGDDDVMPDPHMRLGRANLTVHLPASATPFPFITSMEMTRMFRIMDDAPRLGPEGDFLDLHIRARDTSVRRRAS